jgi:tyrosinase
MANGQVLTRYDIHDLNNGLVPDFPVTDGWDDISLYYAKALQKMGYIENPAPGKEVETMWTYSETPTHYYFQAAMHWTPKYPGTPPPPYDAWWNHCTHEHGLTATAETFFLPWHRAFIYWYEVIIRSFVAELGGPDAWALPYWNYSYYDASDPDGPWPRAKLPDVFTKPMLPDGTGNPLFIDDPAKRGLQPGQFLQPDTVPYYFDAWGRSVYYGPPPDYSGFNSSLDGGPHGPVHVATGFGNEPKPGWMRFTSIAAFDPIFWLHHSEIDRFWVGWLANGHSNPTDDWWLNATGDPEYHRRWNFWADGDIHNVINVYPEQLLDNENLGAPFPYSYRYENMPQTPAPRPSGHDRRAVTIPEAALTGANAQLAATDEPVRIGVDPVTATIPLGDEVEPALAAVDAAPEKPPVVLLHLRGLASEGPAGNYDLYMNYPDADRHTGASVPHYVGMLSSFGAEHSHGGSEGGLRRDFDITELVSHLRQADEWDSSNATVTFVPASPLPREELASSELRVGSISIETA